MIKYAFWNNKGGTGKTSLAFQAMCWYAQNHPSEKILALDVCPQANLSELFLGGLTNSGSAKLLQRQGLSPRCTIGGYFQMRLPAPYTVPSFNPKDFITRPVQYNSQVPGNVDLLCGDPLLELQANAMNTLANTQIPGTDTWIAIIDWLKDFLTPLAEEYEAVFIDANPSFSVYTQIALSSANLLVLPVMADDSSRRAIQNVFSLIYGLKLPSEIYAAYAFGTKLKNFGRALPKVHLIAKNRLTQYMVTAAGYAAVLRSIDELVASLLGSDPNMFSFSKVSQGIVDVRDFQTAGVVAFAKGCPFYALQSGRLDIGGHRVRVDEQQRLNCVNAMDDLVRHLRRAAQTV
jgi:cellulose biosynthesis protein BcsQ